MGADLGSYGTSDFLLCPLGRRVLHFRDASSERNAGRMGILDRLRRRQPEVTSETAATSDEARGTFFKVVPVVAVPQFVCCIDILGFSAFTLKSTLQESIDDLAIIRSILMQSAVLTAQRHGYLRDEDSLGKYTLNPFDPAIRLPFRYVMASDSVFFWGMDTIDKLIIAMKSVAFSLEMMARRQGRFVRGCVARGAPLINPLAGIYAGKPIVEAVDFEKSMLAPGVVIPLELLNADEREAVVSHIPYFVPTVYRLRNGTQRPCLYVNWLYGYVRAKKISGLDALRRQMEADGFFREKIDQLLDLVADNLGTFPFPVLDDELGA